MARGGFDDLHFEIGVHAAHGGDALVERIVHLALRGHRRGFRHAVADGDLWHVHVLLHALHHLDGTGRAGHDAGAQGREIGRGEIRMLGLGDEHGGNPVQRGAAFLLDGGQHRCRVKGFAGIDHARAVGGGRQVAHDLPEAVIQRHGDADAIVLAVLQRAADEVAVVQDVVVGQGRALGEAGGAAGVLNVDGIVGIQRLLTVVHFLLGDVPGVFLQLAPFVVDDEGLDVLGQTLLHLLEHGHVVGMAEPARQDEQRAGRLPQHVFQLVAAVGRVDVHHDGADARGGVLGDRPLVAVG